jgi:hypothetical protein
LAGNHLETAWCNLLLLRRRRRRRKRRRWAGLDGYTGYDGTSRSSSGTQRDQVLRRGHAALALDGGRGFSAGYSSLDGTVVVFAGFDGCCCTVSCFSSGKTTFPIESLHVVVILTRSADDTFVGSVGAVHHSVSHLDGADAARLPALASELQPRAIFIGSVGTVANAILNLVQRDANVRVVSTGHFL